MSKPHKQSYNHWWLLLNFHEFSIENSIHIKHLFQVYTIASLHHLKDLHYIYIIPKIYIKGQCIAFGMF